MNRFCVALIVVAFVAVACQQGGNPNADQQIIIASDMPTSAWSDAQAWDEAVAYAIREQPAIRGFKVNYWSLDDSLGPDPFQLRGLENMKRMEANRWVLGTVAASSSHVTLLQIPEANQAPLAMISPTDTVSCLTIADPSCDPEPSALRPSGTNNFFRIAPPDPLQGTDMARYIATKLGIRHVAVFNEWGSTGERYINAFSTELMKLGGDIVLDQQLADGTNKFATFLTEAKGDGAQAVYAVAGADQGACKAAAQMKGIMPNALFLATDGITLDPACAEDIGADAAEGILGTKTDVDPRFSSDLEVKRFVAAYGKLHPRSSDMAAYTFAAYDCARILMAAIEHAIDAANGAFPSRAGVIQALAATRDFHGVTGTYSFDSNGDATAPMMTLYRFTSGQWVPVS